MSDSVEACILAGGLSSRMGADKAALKLGGRTLLDWAKLAPRELGLKVHVIKQDCVARCGPLGGVYTALQGIDCPGVIFLSCDMPFVGTRLLERLSKQSEKGQGRCVFSEVDGYAGFPFLLLRAALPLVEQMIAERRYSLQELARRCEAGTLKMASRDQWRMINVNTPEMFKKAEGLLERVSKTCALVL